MLFLSSAPCSDVVAVKKPAGVVFLVVVVVGVGVGVACEAVLGV